jgi:hypothetical protein
MRIRLLVLCLYVAACGPKRPAVLAPTPAPPRTATEVRASFGATWAAAIDAFAESTVPIATIDRSSGLLVPASGLYFGGKADTTYADCGQQLELVRGKTWEYRPVIPSDARYNVRIKGDSAKSSVQVNSLYLSAVGACVSRGRWEDRIEQNIKQRAERP